MALKASELRIGNWHLGDGNPLQIDAFDIKDLSDDPQDDFYQPIPLTEEWLLKFGFDKLPFDRTSLEYKKDIYRLIGSEDKWFCLAVMNFVHTKVRVQYVHQLQNLYFALTGEELEMK